MLGRKIKKREGKIGVRFTKAPKRIIGRMERLGISKRLDYLRDGRA